MLSRLSCGCQVKVVAVLLLSICILRCLGIGVADLLSAPDFGVLRFRCLIRMPALGSIGELVRLLEGNKQ